METKASTTSIWSTKVYTQNADKPDLRSGTSGTVWKLSIRASLHIYTGKRGKRKTLSRVPTDTNMNAVCALSDTNLKYDFSFLYFPNSSLTLCILVHFIPTFSLFLENIFFLNQCTHTPKHTPKIRINRVRPIAGQVNSSNHPSGIYGQVYSNLDVPSGKSTSLQPYLSVPARYTHKH